MFVPYASNDNIFIYIKLKCAIKIYQNNILQSSSFVNINISMHEIKISRQTISINRISIHKTRFFFHLTDNCSSVRYIIIINLVLFILSRWEIVRFIQRTDFPIIKFQFQQLSMSLLANFSILSSGMGLGFPAITYQSLTDKSDPMALNNEEASWFGKFVYFTFSLRHWLKNLKNIRIRCGYSFESNQLLVEMLARKYDERVGIYANWFVYFVYHPRASPD